MLEAQVFHHLLHQQVLVVLVIHGPIPGLPTQVEVVELPYLEENQVELVELVAVDQGLQIQVVVVV